MKTRCISCGRRMEIAGRQPRGSSVHLSDRHAPRRNDVNAFLVMIWAVTDPHGFFWPVFPIIGWGIIVVLNAWDVYWRPAITEEDIQNEIKQPDYGHKWRGQALTGSSRARTARTSMNRGA